MSRGRRASSRVVLSAGASGAVNNLSSDTPDMYDKGDQMRRRGHQQSSPMKKASRIPSSAKLQRSGRGAAGSAFTSSARPASSIGMRSNRGRQGGVAVASASAAAARGGGGARSRRTGTTGRNVLGDIRETKQGRLSGASVAAATSSIPRAAAATAAAAAASRGGSNKKTLTPSESMPALRPLRSRGTPLDAARARLGPKDAWGDNNRGFVVRNVDDIVDSFNAIDARDAPDASSGVVVAGRRPGSLRPLAGSPRAAQPKRQNAAPPRAIHASGWNDRFHTAAGASPLDMAPPPLPSFKAKSRKRTAASRKKLASSASNRPAGASDRLQDKWNQQRRQDHEEQAMVLGSASMAFSQYPVAHASNNNAGALEAPDELPEPRRSLAESLLHLTMVADTKFNLDEERQQMSRTQAAIISREEAAAVAAAGGDGNSDSKVARIEDEIARIVRIMSTHTAPAEAKNCDGEGEGGKDSVKQATIDLRQTAPRWQVAGYLRDALGDQVLSFFPTNSLAPNLNLTAEQRQKLAEAADQEDAVPSVPFAAGYDPGYSFHGVDLPIISSALKNSLVTDIFDAAPDSMHLAPDLRSLRPRASKYQFASVRPHLYTVEAQDEWAQVVPDPRPAPEACERSSFVIPDYSPAEKEISDNLLFQASNVLMRPHTSTTQLKLDESKLDAAAAARSVNREVIRSPAQENVGARPGAKSPGVPGSRKTSPPAKQFSPQGRESAKPRQPLAITIEESPNPSPFASVPLVGRTPRGQSPPAATIQTEHSADGALMFRSIAHEGVTTLSPMNAAAAAAAASGSGSLMVPASVATQPDPNALLTSAILQQLLSNQGGSRGSSGLDPAVLQTVVASSAATNPLAAVLATALLNQGKSSPGSKGSRGRRARSPYSDRGSGSLRGSPDNSRYGNNRREQRASREEEHLSSREFLTDRSARRHDRDRHRDRRRDRDRDRDRHRDHRSRDRSGRRRAKSPQHRSIEDDFPDASARSSAPDSHRGGRLSPVGSAPEYSDDEEVVQDVVPDHVKKELFTKCRNNRHAQIEQMFQSGVPVDTSDKFGNQCLHIACQNGNKRMVKACLRWGANINAQNIQGQTPLHYTFAYNYDKVGAYLISKGADDSQTNFFGMSCYDGLRPDDRDEAIRLLKEHLGNVSDVVITQTLGEG